MARQRRRHSLARSGFDSCRPARDLQLALVQTLRANEAIYGNSHIKVAISLLNLADTHGVLGELTIQRNVLERALAITCAHHGDEHIDVARVRFNLARCLERLTMNEEAMVEMHRAHGQFKISLGLDHALTRSASDFLSKACDADRETEIEPESDGASSCCMALIVSRANKLAGLL